MRKQLELFDENEVIAQSVIDHHEPIIQIEEAKTEALMEHDFDHHDDLCILQCDIEEAVESGDNDRLVELVQMRTAYSQ